MSILVDTNLLVYATFADMAEHHPTRAWLSERFADGDSFVGLCWPVLYSYVRLTSSRRIMGDAALGLNEAWSAGDALRRQSTARIVEAGPTHQSIAAELIATPGLRSDDVPDVQLAALAIEHGLTLCSHDRGFARFGRLSWIDPLSAD